MQFVFANLKTWRQMIQHRSSIFTFFYLIVYIDIRRTSPLQMTWEDIEMDVISYRLRNESDYTVRGLQSAIKP